MQTNIKVISLVIFITLAIFALFVFAGIIPLGKNKQGSGSMGTVIIWGTFNKNTMANVLEKFQRENPLFLIQYVQKSAENFDRELLEALASRTGPDLFFIDNELAYKYSNKIFSIPYQSYPVATYKNYFASASDVFLSSRGILALPLAIDPMVLYYNRSILDSHNILYPPAYWEDLEDLALVLNKKNSLNQFSQSAISLGQFVNNKNAKGILTTLFMQAGSSIIAEQNSRFVSTLDSSSTNYSLSSILKFFTDFADPIKSIYSWNRALPEASNFFSSGNLALYFGYSSELRSLINRNPNQDFLVAPMLQFKNNNNKITSAKVIGLAISTGANNFNGAFLAAGSMATGNFAIDFSNAFYTIPARRDLLNVQATDAYYPIFYSSALYARSWLDPDPISTNLIFQRAAESVLANNLSDYEAIRDAHQKINLLLIR